jgi:hypothetical protein
MIGHLALYIIIPEIILGLSIYYSFMLIRDRKQLMKIPVIFILMIVSLGSAVFFYFLFDRILIP